MSTVTVTMIDGNKEVDTKAWLTGRWDKKLRAYALDTIYASLDEMPDPLPLGVTGSRSLSWAEKQGHITHLQCLKLWGPTGYDYIDEANAKEIARLEATS